MMLGWSCFRIGKLDEAEAQMREAVVADPGACATHANLAVVLQARGRLDEAAASYARALELNGDDVQCLLNLGVCKLDLHDLPAGEALIRRATAIDGDRARTWANLGVALALQNRHDEALEAFERADRDRDANTGDDVENFVNFALHLREAGRTLDAIDLYEKHLPSRPSLTGHNDYAYALLDGRSPGRRLEPVRVPLDARALAQLRPAFNRPAWGGQDLRGRSSCCAPSRASATFSSSCATRRW